MNTQLDTNARYRHAEMPGVAWYIKRLDVETVTDGCPGHYDDDFALDSCGLGEGYFCDGACVEGSPTGMVVAVMVGDNREHIVDPDDLSVIDEDEFCGCCGQIGCPWG